MNEGDSARKGGREREKLTGKRREERRRAIMTDPPFPEKRGEDVWWHFLPL